MLIRYLMHFHAWAQRTLRQKKQIRPAITIVLISTGIGFLAYFLVLNEKALVPRFISGVDKGQELAASAEDTTLWLTIPKMARVDDLPVYDAPANDETALDASATHVRGTDFPWQRGGANSYIAGHRTGLPGTKSYLVFYDLNELKKNDEILVRDAKGVQYSYKVFDKAIVKPENWAFSQDDSDSSILTLVTCTLPDYQERLLVRAELEEVKRAHTPPQDSST